MAINYSKSLSIKQKDGVYQDINYSFNLSELEIEDQILKDNMTNLNINSPEELVKYLLDHSGTGSSNKAIPFPCLNSNSLIYDGTEKNAPVINLNGEDYFTLQDVLENVNVIGVKNAIDAGTYSVSFSLKDIETSKWESLGDIPEEGEILLPTVPENRTDVITWEWNIYKALNNASVDKTSLNMNFDTRTTTITISNSPGDFTVVSNNTSICTASKNGNIITVNAIKNGSTTISLKWTNLKNYNDKEIIINTAISGMPNSILNNNTPEVIQKVTRAGLAPSYWNVGDAVVISLNGAIGNLTLNGYYWIYILGFNHNSKIEGNNSIHFRFGKSGFPNGADIAFSDSKYSTTGDDTAFRMNLTNTNTGGWKDSYMRKTICSAFKATFNSNWRSVISLCTKYTDNVGNNINLANNITATIDDIFLLSEFETFGNRYSANSAEQNYQQQYDYYKNGNSQANRKHDNTASECAWWLRSLRISTTTHFCSVHTSGSYNSHYANYSFGFAPAFVVS